MITLLIYYLLEFSPKDGLINALKALFLLTAFIAEAPFYIYFLLYLISQLLSKLIEKDKYYANLNKKRYEQNNTRL